MDSNCAMCRKWLKNKQSAEMESLNKEISVIKNEIEGECSLFLNVGLEINKLLQSAWKKEQQIEGQKDLIKFLMEMVKFLYKKQQELQDVFSACGGSGPGSSRGGGGGAGGSGSGTDSTCVSKGEAEALRKDNENLKRQLQELQAGGGGGRGSSESCGTMKLKLKAMEEQLEECRERNRTLMAELNGLTSGNKAAQDQLNSMREMEDLKKKYDSEKEEHAAYRRDSGQLIDELRQKSAASVQLQEQIKNLQKDSESLRSAQRKSIEQIADLNSEIQVKNREIQSLHEASVKSPSGTTALEEMQNNISLGSYKVKSVASNESKQVSASAKVKSLSSIAELPEEPALLTDEELRNKREAQRAGLKTIEDYAEALTQEQNERDEERSKRSQEAKNLRNTIAELQKALNNAQAKGGDTQLAVDAYKKSINELETSRDRYKMEISQQRLTITNLQEALVATKQQLEEQQKVANDVSSGWTPWWLKGKSGGDNKTITATAVLEKLKGLDEAVQTLHDVILDLEVENFSYVQDIAILESRLLKYQQTCKCHEKELERCQTEVNRLRQEMGLPPDPSFTSGGTGVIVITELPSDMEEEIKKMEEMEAIIKKKEACLMAQTACGSQTCSCTKELEKCKEIMAQMRQRIGRASAVIMKNVEQFDELKSAKDTGMATLKNENEELRKSISDLKDKLNANEEQRRSLQMEMDELSSYHQESKVQMDYLRQEKSRLCCCIKQMEDHLRKRNDEECKLAGCISDLEEESNCLRNALHHKEQHLAAALDENHQLRHEVHRLSSGQSSQHASKCGHCCKVKSDITKMHHALQKVQAEKEHLEVTNRSLRKEVHNLQNSFQQMSESVVTLKQKLADAKVTRNEICAESRVLIDNVRAWLAIQSAINQRFAQKIRDDEVLIKKLHEDMGKCQSRRNSSSKGGQCPITGNPCRAMWGPDMRFYYVDTPAPGSSRLHESEVHDDDHNNSHLLSHCLRRVESINYELQKSNEYWQTKMEEEEEEEEDHAVTKDD